MHEEGGVCHRDIKPDNILINIKKDPKITYKIKLCDFNVARKFKNRNMMTRTGLEEWSAPEMLEGGVYNEKVDLWSAGCVLYFMIAG